MGYLKWGVALVLLLFVAALFDYYVPSRSVVQIIHTEVVREDHRTTDTAGNVVVQTNDIRQIDTIRKDGKPYVFKNTDAPLYFKFDAADLSTVAQKYQSTKQNPQWVIITSYGWRVPVMTWFPNALYISPVDGPVNLFPWLRIAVAAFFLILLLLVWRLVMLFVNRYVDPVIDEVDREVDARSDTFTRSVRRLRRAVLGPSR